MIGGVEGKDGKLSSLVVDAVVEGLVVDGMRIAGGVGIAYEVAVVAGKEFECCMSGNAVDIKMVLCGATLLGDADVECHEKYQQ